MRHLHQAQVLGIAALGEEKMELSFGPDSHLFAGRVTAEDQVLGAPLLQDGQRVSQAGQPRRWMLDREGKGNTGSTELPSYVITDSGLE